jgi:hypothetical protein
MKSKIEESGGVNAKASWVWKSELAEWFARGSVATAVLNVNPIYTLGKLAGMKAFWFCEILLRV